MYSNSKKTTERFFFAKEYFPKNADSYSSIADEMSDYKQNQENDLNNEQTIWDLTGRICFQSTN